jgi:C-terminal processing protease CtpA/Prc
MKKLLIGLLFLLIGISCNSQEGLNLDFERIENGKPEGWEIFGNGAHKLSIDTVNVYSGKSSAVIEQQGDGANFKAWSYSIPAKYAGNKIKLTGYLKTQDVSEGWAGLWLRIDPSVGFDNMQNRGIKGTNDWKKYEIELDLKPDQARKIVFGGLLVGKGKMWLDDLDITIDGAPLEETKPRKLLPAEKDTVFNDGSKITFPKLEEDLIKDLELLGRIWGFLKYHHPNVGAGNYNWDFELFRFLPDYLKNDIPEQRDRLLSEWIEGYGEFPLCENCLDSAKEYFLKPDHNWIEQAKITTSLKQKLLHIQKNRHQGNHFYIGMVPNVGNPEFKNENAYENIPYPDDGYRLLALFRFWNIIQYYFPYKHLMDENWNHKLKEYIPVFLSAKNELEYELAVVQIIGNVQDTHANLWGGNNAIEDWKGKYYPPVHLGFVENQLTILDYYNPELKEKVGLEIGDIITKINGKNIFEIIEKRKRFYPASNEPTRLRDLSTDLLRSNELEVQISIIRDKEEKTKALALYERDSLNIYRWYRRDNEPSFKILDGNIGYITLKTIKQEDIEIIKDTFKTTKGIIIDIRNYPSTFVPFSLGSYFVEDNTPFVKFTKGNINNPGEFTFTESIRIPNSDQPYKGKLVVIVNELSQSQAEYTAMAFRSGLNTTIIGSTTAGADGNISSILLPGGLRTMISGIGVYYPDGKETQRIGIVPDVVVMPTIKGIKQGRDELLEKAIEIVNK